MKYLPLLCILLLGLMSCDTRSTPSGNADAAKSSVDWKTVDPLIIDSLKRDCEAVDLIFYKLPISMSINERKEIVENLETIGPKVGKWTNKCVSSGRFFYQVKGKVTLEAELFLSDSCNAMVFYRDRKYMGLNMITPKGVDLLNSIMNKAETQTGMR